MATVIVVRRRLSAGATCVAVLLNGNELATAVRAYLVARNVYAGPVTTVSYETPDDDTTNAVVIVDPDSRLIIDGRVHEP